MGNQASTTLQGPAIAGTPEGLRAGENLRGMFGWLRVPGRWDGETFKRPDRDLEALPLAG
ncbi:MAG: hypothetical protein V5A47_13990 [Bacteroidales bacterium]|nr:hypothetical protein [Bacteroidales bacterium]